MEEYATNIFCASTNNERDLKKIEAFLSENFDYCFLCDDAGILEAEFPSCMEYPKELIDELIESLEDKDTVYIRVLTYLLEKEYVSFRIFAQGKWNIKLE